MKILYQDQFLIAVNKPAGLLVHRSNLDKNETEFALQQVRELANKFVYPIHRLDKPTSGVLLFALSSDIAQVMSDKFKTDEIGKKYLAIVRGFTKEKETIDYPLRKIKERFGKPSIKTDETQDAITQLTRLATIELDNAVDKYPTSRYSLVELTPKTGRRHQLRRHMKHISHPIIGDPKYGKSSHNNFFKDQLNCSKLLLAAISLNFSHPVTEEDIEIYAEPDDSFNLILKKFNFDFKKCYPKSIVESK